MKSKLLLVILLSLLSYGINFWEPSIYFLDEAKNAGCAAEMMKDGNFFVPTFNGGFHDKPVLQYIFMMAAYKVFGVNAFSARLFSVILGTLMVVTVFWFAGKIFSKRIAFYASLVLIASAQMSWQFRMAAPDPYLLFFLTLGLLSFYYGYSTQKVRYLYVFYVCVGLGFLSKGPIAFALPGLSVVVFLLLNKDFSWSRIVSLKAFQGMAVALAVGAPWYIGTGFATNWEWPEYFFVTHNISRYTSTFEGHGGFLFDGVLIVFVALLPLSIVLPQAFSMAWKRRRVQPFLLFCISVFLAVIGFFFFSKTVLPSYPAPCLPFVAIIIAFFVDKVDQKNAIKKYRLTVNALIYLLISAALPAAAWFAMRSVPELQSLSPAHSLVFVAAFVGGAWGLVELRRGHMKRSFYVYNASFIILITLVFSITMPAIDRMNPVSQSLFLFEEDIPVAYYKRINPAYVFNLQRKIPRLENEAELDDFIKSNGKVYIISARKEWGEVNKPDLEVVFEKKYLFEPPTSIVVLAQ